MNTHVLQTTALLLAATTASAQWQQITPTLSPSGRGGHGMTFDPINGGVLIFGGDTLGFPVGAVNQTWSYNGTTWAQLSPATSPPASAGIELVFDFNRGVFVTYGSLNTSPFGGASADRTWEYNGTTWTQIFPVTTPGGLGLYGMCFDSARNKVVIYGGIADNFFPIAANGTWEYDGTNWALITTAGSPGPLERPAMCFHTGLGKNVLFGGIDPQTGGVDTTWLYDGTNWTAAAVVGSKPAARTGAKMVYDNVRGICVMTGGADPISGSAIVDTWEFDLANLTWTQVPTATTGRLNAGLAFVPGRRQVVQFGGWNFQTFTALADTREYGARSRTFGTGCAGSNGVPALAAVDAPRLGQNYTLNLTNLNPSIGIAVMVLSLTQIPATSLSGIGMTGCNAYMTADLLLTLSASAGAASLTTGIPSTISLMGTPLFSQGISVDPNINPAWLTVSNAHEGVLGR